MIVKRYALRVAAGPAEDLVTSCYRDRQLQTTFNDPSREAGKEAAGDTCAVT